MQIGQLPTLTSLAHFCSTAPELRDRAVLCIVPEPKDAALLADLLAIFAPARHVVVWNGSVMKLSGLHDPQTITIIDAAQAQRAQLPGPNSLSRLSLSLESHQCIALSDVKNFLGKQGYERDKHAHDEGSFAVHGSTLDIFVQHPIRITWNGNVIESIGRVDLKTGMQTPLHHVILPPRQIRGRSTILAHCTNIAMVTWNVAVPTTALASLISTESFEIRNGENAGYHEPKAYHRRYEDIHRDREGLQTTVLTKDVEKAHALFPDARIVSFATPIPGTINQTRGFAIFTDHDIGWAVTPNKRRPAADTSFITRMQKGDFVVHMIHGIARFAGMTHMHINGHNREYFILEYAQGDKIYLPVSSADRIDKYIGQPHPSLHRLSDASWSEAVRRVQIQTLEFARGLLQLHAARAVVSAPALQAFPEEESACNAQFPYPLTSDQETAISQIFHDLEQTQPMDRLLCGDVGFGKTEVALRAAARTILNGWQVAMLAPTTILVQQHFDTFVDRLASLGANVALLSRWQTPKEQQRVADGLRKGTIDVVVGTHRLLSHDISFKKLGLLVIDEEQRFGVRAKEALQRVRHHCHVLTMTATPIPRTFHLSLGGVRDISTIMTPPSQRQITTVVIDRYDDERIRNAIIAEHARGGQTYYLCNRIHEIPHRRAMLARLVPHLGIGVAHGQLPSAALAAVMHAFDEGKIDILLATTIIENGLDIPRANTLIVEQAAHLGLAELYQLKGRVGRSHLPGIAYFLYKTARLDRAAQQRLQALAETQYLGAGYELALKDMQLRGVGNILGKQQHGNATAIGLHLYLRLLHSAVTSLRAEDTPKIPRDIPINLPLDARIPEHLIREESERIMRYQKLANIQDIAELQLQRHQWMSRTDDPGMEGLFDLLEIRLRASTTPLLGIDTVYPNASNTLSSPRLILTSERPFPPLPSPWDRMQPTKIRATIDELGEHWVQKLCALLETMAISTA